MQYWSLLPSLLGQRDARENDRPTTTTIALSNAPWAQHMPRSRRCTTRGAAFEPLQIFWLIDRV